MDLYSNFQALAAGERFDIDYRYRWTDLETAIIVIVPHGGWIEPGTSELGELIADDDLSFYAFEGLGKPRRHRDLHITSHRFDEPMALQLVGAAETAIAIHGRANTDDPAVWLGGRNAALRDAVGTSLRAAGFVAAAAKPGLDARHPNNICNRGKSGAGVQLELPRSLRDQLQSDPAQTQRFVAAIRQPIGHLRA